MLTTGPQVASSVRSWQLPSEAVGYMKKAPARGASERRNHRLLKAR